MNFKTLQWKMYGNSDLPSDQPHKCVKIKENNMTQLKSSKRFYEKQRIFSFFN